MQHTLIAIVSWAFLCGSTAAGAASQDGYPSHPVRLVIAQAPGSSIDAMCRVIAAKMGELLGEQFVADNRTGAGGTIGGGIVAHSEPDGSTLLCAATPSPLLRPQPSHPS